MLINKVLVETGFMDLIKQVREPEIKARHWCEPGNELIIIFFIFGLAAMIIYSIAENINNYVCAAIINQFVDLRTVL